MIILNKGLNLLVLLSYIYKLAIFVKFNFTLRTKIVELAWRSGSVMDCHATARGSIPYGNGVFTELHVLRKGQ